MMNKTHSARLIQSYMMGILDLLLILKEMLLIFYN